MEFLVDSSENVLKMKNIFNENNFILVKHYGSLSILVAPFRTLVLMMVVVITFMHKKNMGIFKKDFFLLNLIWILMATFLMGVLL
jgi:hypothetical protein